MSDECINSIDNPIASIIKYTHIRFPLILLPAKLHFDFFGSVNSIEVLFNTC